MARKVYIRVVAEHTPDGDEVPLWLVWEDGRRYNVDRLLDVRRAASTKVGGTGMRYTVRIEGNTTYLFNDEGRWYVEAKA